MYSGNDGILDFSEIYEVALSIYFESEGPVTQIISQVVNERSVCVLFCAELNNEHFNALSPVSGVRG
jgi:hypothetical protein